MNLTTSFEHTLDVGSVMCVAHSLSCTESSSIWSHVQLYEILVESDMDGPITVVLYWLQIFS